MMKKWLVLILTVALLATSLCPYVYAEEIEDEIIMEDEFIFDDTEIEQQDPISEVPVEDVKITDSEEIVIIPEEDIEEESAVFTKEEEILMDLGILEFDDPSAIVTRALFVAAVANLCGYTDGDYSIGNRFSDVTEEHEFENQIAFAADMKLVAGSGGKFRPDDAINEEEMAVVALRALGYDNFSPYIKIDIVKARCEGVFSGVTIKKNGTINFENATKAIYNTMNLPMIMITGVVTGKEGSELILNKDETTALNYYKHIYMEKGVVTDNGITSFSGDTDIDINRVKIDGVVYKRDKTLANDLLGHKLEIYHDKENNILHISDITDDDDILYIKADDIISATMGEIKYADKNERIRTINFPLSANIVYNGKALKPGEYNKALLKPQIGGIELIRTNGKSYDFLNITSQYNCVVDKIHDNDGLYTFVDVKSNDKNVIVDIDDVGTSVWIVDKDDIIVDCSGIHQYNVLSVAQSLDKQYTFIRVNTENAKGVIDKIVNGTKQRIFVDDNEYTLAYDAISSEITLNVFGWFYFDIYGDIAYFKSFAKYEQRFGYLISAGIERSPFSQKFKAKIFDASGQVIVSAAEKTLKVDGVPFKNASFGSVVEKFYVGSEFRPCMIRYELDLDGNIKSIDTCEKVNETDDSLREITAPKGQEAANTGIFINKLKYFKTSNQFDGQLFINDDTLVFGIPVGEHEDDDYQMLKIDYFVNSRYYDVEFYTDDSQSDIAKAVLVRYAAKYDEDNLNSKNYVIMPSVYPSMMDTGLVEEVITSIDRNGEVITQATILRLHENKRYTYTIRWPEIEGEFAPGYIVRYYVINNRIIDAEMMFDLNTCNVGSPRKLSSTIDTFIVRQNKRDLADSSTTFEKTPMVTAAWSLAYLDVLSTKGGMLKGVTGDASVDWPEEHIDRTLTKNINFVYKYDSKNSLGIISDLESIIGYEDTQSDCSKVVILYNSARPLAVIILDN